jgi:hypothetical protein
MKRNMHEGIFFKIAKQINMQRRVEMPEIGFDSPAEPEPVGGAVGLLLQHLHYLKPIVHFHWFDRQRKHIDPVKKISWTIQRHIYMGWKMVCFYSQPRNYVLPNPPSPPPCKVGRKTRGLTARTG